MKTFEINKTYECRSIGDWDCVWHYTVVSRTAKTITVLSDKGETRKLRIIKGASEMLNAECVYPLGKYSMCPILSADKI